MFLKSLLISGLQWTLALGVVVGFTPAVRAEVDWNLNTTVQVGVDAWHIPSADEGHPLQALLFLPDTDTEWKPRSVSPWYTLQSHLHIGTQSEVVLRARGNQGHGASLDQLSYDHAISPFFGLRAGVLDYRATWCRGYDRDNPWVRENDPFCTIKSVNVATASAPALQAYTKFDLSNYQVQTLAGLYRPKAFGYEPREFSNLFLPPTAEVIKNNKHAVSLNVTNLVTSTEWRLSLIGAQQSFYDQIRSPNDSSVTKLNFHQNVNSVFLGVSAELMPRVRSKITHLRSNVKTRCELLDPPRTADCESRFRKDSTVLELSYQANPRDVLLMAVSRYNFKQSLKQSDVYSARNESVSLSWRRDWKKGWFSALQLTHARISVPYNNYPNLVPYEVGNTKAWGAGLRVGYEI